MSLHRWAARRDGPEQAIKQALEAVGAIVLKVSGKGLPDLLISYKGKWTPLEVKAKHGMLTEAQAMLQARAMFPVARTPEDALREIGAIR